ncbi:hypothetical protein [Ectopseudomonas mendocina]|uniref:hypothetical protein n=1 Tax=Ectopseudomonas mendocina TaxID=300 RepID=UPI003F03DF33
MAKPKPFTRAHGVIIVRNSREDYIQHTLTPQELATVALDVLVKELGTEGARQFLRKEFARYHRDYLGDGRDDRLPRIADYDPSNVAARAHTISR